MISTAKEKQGADGMRAAKEQHGNSRIGLAADDLPSKGKELKSEEAKCKGTVLIRSDTRRKSIGSCGTATAQVCSALPWIRNEMLRGAKDLHC